MIAFLLVQYLANSPQVCAKPVNIITHVNKFHLHSLAFLSLRLAFSSFLFLFYFYMSLKKATHLGLRLLGHRQTLNCVLHMTRIRTVCLLTLSTSAYVSRLQRTSVSSRSSDTSLALLTQFPLIWIATVSVMLTVVGIDRYYCVHIQYCSGLYLLYVCCRH